MIHLKRKIEKEEIKIQNSWLKKILSIDFVGQSPKLAHPWGNWVENISIQELEAKKNPIVAQSAMREWKIRVLDFQQESREKNSGPNEREFRGSYKGIGLSGLSSISLNPENFLLISLSFSAANLPRNWPHWLNRYLGRYLKNWLTLVVADINHQF